MHSIGPLFGKLCLERELWHLGFASCLIDPVVEDPVAFIAKGLSMYHFFVNLPHPPLTHLGTLNGGELFMEI